MRKLSLLAIAFCLHITMYAQIDTSTYKKKVDFIIQLLDPSKATTGILYDRVEPFSGLREFGHGDTPDKSYGGHFFQALSDLAEADYNQSPQRIQIIENLVAEVKSQNASHVLPIGGIRYKFDLFDPERLTDGTLILGSDDKLRVNPARSSVSYLVQQTTFVGDILGMDIKPGSYELFADPALWQCNTGESLAYYQIFDGQTLLGRMELGQKLNINLASAGEKIFRVEAHTVAGNVYSNLSVLEVNAITTNADEREDSDPYWAQNFPPSCNIRSYPISASIPFTGYETGDSPEFGQAEYSIYKRYADQYNCGLQTVKKPLLILDGFDPLDNRKAECLYGKYLRYFEQTEGVDKFLGNKVRSPENGYDIIFLNFKDWTTPSGKLIRGGADYVERNAMVLIELINQVNAAMVANGSTEKLVIIGPSMGGLISRYALAYMEKKYAETPAQKWNHNCRLWVSFDSPHQGANISIGAQQFLKFWGENDVPEAQASLDLELGSTAAKQMLVHHYSNPGNNPLDHSAPGYRNRFLNSLITNGLPGSYGYPKNLRKVALINGSIKGTLFGTNCSQATKLEAFVTVKAWRFLNFLYRQVFRPLRVGYGKTFISPANSPCTVFSGYKQGGSPSDVENNFQDNSISPVSYDVGPGGAFPIFGEIGSSNSPAHRPLPLFSINPNGIIKAIFKKVVPSYIAPFVNIPTVGNINMVIGGHSFGLGTRLTFENNQMNCSFIPTKSALGFGYKNFTTAMSGNLGEDLSNRNLVCSGEIPFDNYYAPSVNQDHVQTTKENVDWMMAELIGSPISPNIGNDNSIATYGPGALCPGATGEFGLEVPSSSGFQFNWTLTGGATMDNPHSNPVAITVDPDNQNDNIIATCTVMKNGCAVYNPKKFTFNGLSDIPDLIVKCGSQKDNTIPGDAICMNMDQYTPANIRYLYLKSIPEGGIWNITWTPLPGDNGVSPILEPVFFNGFYRSARIFANGANPVRYKVRIESECGSREKEFVMNYSYASNGDYCISCDNGAQWLRVSPDPVIKGTDHNISFVTPRSISLPATGEILDQRGNSVIRFEISNPLQTVPVEKLDLAEYTLKVSSGTSVETAKFIVAKTATDRMVISPNPLIKGIDETALVRIFGSATTDDRFNVILTNEQNAVVKDIWVEGREFSLDVTDLKIGSYVVTVKGENTLFEEVLEMKMKGQPYIQVNPNPVMDVLNAEIINPIDPDDAYKITVTDKLGLNVLETTHEGSAFQLDLSGLPPDLYYVKMTGKGLTLSKLFRKE